MAERSRSALVLVLVLAGCRGGGAGAAEGSGSDGTGEVACTEVGQSELRRLTTVQYDNTVRDLLGVGGSPASGFSSDERIGPFRSNIVAPIGELQAEQYMTAAETVAAQAVQRLDALLSCDPASVGERACAEQLIAALAPRAFRRPLRDGEHERLLEVYDAGRSEADFTNGIRLVIATLLQSPHFLYHVEIGREDDATALTNHEFAARLSYFLWETMPDATLTAVADAGELASDEAIVAQVDRMLADPRAREGVASFHLQWLGVDELERVEKDDAVYPNFARGLAEAMKAETAAFASAVVLDEHGTLGTLLTADFTYTEDPELLGLYGATLPADHVAGAAVPLPAGQRAGLLTQASVMTRHAHANQTSPVHRGKLVRENVLCQLLPSPPPDVDNTPPDPDPSSTTRERFEQHRADPACAGCHDLIDGIGFGFEHYDAIGAWREVDGADAVDASGWVVGTDFDGDYVGTLELAAKLAESDLVAECTARQWFRFALGRAETAEDMCTIDGLTAVIVESSGTIDVLIRELAISDAFRRRRARSGGDGG